MTNRFNLGEMGGSPQEAAPSMAGRLNAAGRPALFADYQPLIQDKLQKRHSVFSPHQKLRMNVVPLFLNLFVPWGVFVLCMGLTSTYIMYSHPVVVKLLLALVGVAWVVLVGVALWARLYEPDPTWFTHFSLAVGVAALVGAELGGKSFSSFARPYFEIRDLRVVKDVDAATMPGSSLRDVGIVYFGAGHGLSPTLSWHFKSGSLYCVSPILSNVTYPLKQQYDYWAIGKDCCSISASDFRCGSWGNVGPKGGIREVNEGEAQKYRLAVQQAESIYNIRAPNPIFFKWSQDPELEVGSWSTTVFKNFLFCSAVAFVVSAFSVAMHSCRFSWLGRGESAYSMEVYDDPNWQQGGYQKPLDFGVRTYATA